MSEYALHMKQLQRAYMFRVLTSLYLVTFNLIQNYISPHQKFLDPPLASTKIKISVISGNNMQKSNV